MNKKDTNKFYRLQSLESDVIESLKATREELGMNLKDVANMIRKVYTKEEVEALIRHLQEHGI